MVSWLRHLKDGSDLAGPRTERLHGPAVASEFSEGDSDMNSKARSVSLSLTGLTLACFAIALAQGQPAKPAPKVIAIGGGEQSYIRLLGGPPESVTMRAGAVTLAPGKTVGKHSTESYEEFIVILEGQGSMMMNDGARLDMKVGTSVYCPPDTEHDVENTGSGPLRYIYVVAKAR
jgi:mannose-6-phosphate isomerase-like protein (cupin superfamily)